MYAFSRSYENGIEDVNAASTKMIADRFENIVGTVCIITEICHL